MARGCRLAGHRRLRTLLISALVTAGLAVSAGAALGAAGGAGLGRGQGDSRSRPPLPRPHRRRHARTTSSGVPNPLGRRAMWIWEMPYTDGGDLSSIIASAQRYGIGTLIIKSSDGNQPWSQFTPQLISALHANGLRVCAWQYVYGDHPVTEAYLGAAAVRAGADCLLIDAETEYEGKYISAQTYLRRLRGMIGYSYPLALAGFPYIDYHPGFPYSVFLGPGGAQYSAPQMYWRDIGTTVDSVFAHTYSYNLIYGRPIYPLGQVYSNPPARQIVRFRELSRVYGAPGLSWWDWQEARQSAWMAVSRPAGGLPGYIPYTLMAPIGRGWRGDLVVWAQEHLITAGYQVGVDGGFGANTLAAVIAFQTAHGLTPDGIVGPATWQALLRYPTARIVWSRSRHRDRATVATAMTAPTDAATAAVAPGAGPIRFAAVPKSASRPAKRDEIPNARGAGHSPRR